MRLVVGFFALLVFVGTLATTQAQVATDADLIIMRLRTVCNGGQGSPLTIAFDIKPRAGLNPRNIGAYSIIMSYNNLKMTYTGLSQMYAAQYWPAAPIFKNDAYGAAARFVQHQRGTGSPLPLNNQYFTPSNDCASQPLNDGYFEILRFGFNILSSANGTVNFGIYQPLPYRGGLQYQTGGEVSAIWYSNLLNNGNDSTVQITNLLIPVELSAFTAVALPVGAAELHWTTESETSNHGFEVERGDGEHFERIGFVRGQGTVSTKTEYSFTDPGAEASARNGQVIYRLRQVDTDGTSAYSQMAVVMFAPATVALEQNYPNPVAMGETTMIPFGLAVPSTVTLAVYNMLGQRVATLTDAVAHEAGRYQIAWDGRTDSGLPAPAGVYVVRFNANLGGDIVAQTRQISIVR